MQDPIVTKVGSIFTSFFMSFFLISTLFALSMLILFLFHDGLDFFPCLLCLSFVLVLVSFNVPFRFFLFFWFFGNSIISNPSLSMFICNSTRAFHFFFAFLQLHHKWFFLLDFLLQLHCQHLFRCVYIYVLLVIPFQFYLVVFIFFSFFLLCFTICEVHIVYPSLYQV